jgi:hypothetical protein
MNTKTILAVAILGLSTAAGATSGNARPENQTTSGWFANRIVGAYVTLAQVRECGSEDPYETVNNAILFNQGGTVIAIPRYPPGGANGYSRTNDMGTWSYDRATNHYSLRLRYDSFTDGAYTGYSIVERDLTMALDRNSVSGPVHVTTYDPNGNVVYEACGTATSTRL